MTTWLERREKILRHELFVLWRLARQRERESADSMGSSGMSTQAARSILGANIAL